MESLTGRVALITGASRGIGRAVAIELARGGADVLVNYNTNQTAADSVAREIEKLGRRAIAIQADVAKSDQIARLFTTELAPVSVLVNNAGIARPQKLEEIAEQDWDDLIDTNLKSCFMVTQAALPAMRAQRWGRIVNISSVAAHVGGVVGPHYAASKAGMLGLTHYYAKALVREGITANAISPALIDTDMVRSNLNAKPDPIPVGRFGDSGEVAEVVVMLARNAYITGQTIHVNGGVTL